MYNNKNIRVITSIIKTRFLCFFLNWEKNFNRKLNYDYDRNTIGNSINETLLKLRIRKEISLVIKRNKKFVSHNSIEMKTLTGIETKSKKIFFEPLFKKKYASK